jgi:hypothetical protein
VNLKLTRNSYTPDGIFGTLTDENGNRVAMTLEHAYPLLTTFEAKIPSGTYICVRGEHELHNTVPFNTFEITGVAGHSNLLFHVGNFNRDSEGCVLIGEEKGLSMLVGSKRAFADFMTLQDGLQTFTLEVM